MQRTGKRGGSLTSVTVGNGVTVIEENAFDWCDALASVYFVGDEPTIGRFIFREAFATIYYLAGTTGWGAWFDVCPTAPYTWPEFMGVLAPSSSGNPQTLDLAGTTNMVVLVKACTNLVSPVWADVGTATLVGGTNILTDVDWTNHESRVYRVWPYQGP